MKKVVHWHTLKKKRLKPMITIRIVLTNFWHTNLAHISKT